jgi:hypothetical protein
LKFDLAKRIAKGRSKYDKKKFGCKVILVLMGDNDACGADIQLVRNIIFITYRP